MSDSGIPKIRNAIVLGSGPAGYAAAICARAGLDGLVERRLPVGDPGRCKPHPDAYRYAADSCGVPLQRCAMVAAHPWDLQGATGSRHDDRLDRPARPGRARSGRLMRVHAWSGTARRDDGGPPGLAMSPGADAPKRARLDGRLAGTSSCAR